MSTWLFLEPVDVLHLRGNQLFGEAGSYAAPLMPPWPSLPSGALRSRMLVEKPGTIEKFLSGSLDGALRTALGTPSKAGTFRLTALLGGLRRHGTLQPLMPAPADVVVNEHGAFLLRPCEASVRTSALAPMLPVLSAPPGKPIGGRWLNAAGISAWLEGAAPAAADVVAAESLWGADTRVGIEIGAESGTVEQGALFSTDAVAPKVGFGFLVGVGGCSTELLPHSGLVRLGGDGRAAVVHTAAPPPQPDFAAIARNRQFRLLLITPGLFAGGWKLPALAGETWTMPSGASARLRAAAVPRCGVVSGWDLAQWQPKPAQRTAPAGSVYWFDDLSGGEAALRQLHESCLAPDSARSAEGFNHVWIGAWR